MTIPVEIEFNRPAKYKMIKMLGNGACGETVLIHDEGMQCNFVAKKYHPIISEDDEPTFHAELLTRFRDEARILFQLSHPNIVRVYNYFDYKEHKTAYIIMEHIDGKEILEFLHEQPSNADRIFEGVVDGFAHLQRRDILHRDIRPANILVDSDGFAKIIDFGFGKQLASDTADQGRKSISLNWWCETPPEFSQGIYDFKTEVYFVGKLFQLLIQECGLSDFKYRRLLAQMAEPDRDKRSASFSEIRQMIAERKFPELEFSNAEIKSYRAFSRTLFGLVSNVGTDAKFERESAKIIGKLENLYRRTMLEENLASPNELAKIFIIGGFSYWTQAEVEVDTINHFIKLLRSLSEEKRSIVIENLVLKLESVERTRPSMDDEIPF